MALISCAVTSQLICAFVFAYAKIGFSHNEAHLYLGFKGVYIFFFLISTLKQVVGAH